MLLLGCLPRLVDGLLDRAARALLPAPPVRGGIERRSVSVQTASIGGRIGGWKPQQQMPGASVVSAYAPGTQIKNHPPCGSPAPRLDCQCARNDAHARGQKGHVALRPPTGGISIDDRRTAVAGGHTRVTHHSLLRLRPTSEPTQSIPARPQAAAAAPAAAPIPCAYGCGVGRGGVSRCGGCDVSRDGTHSIPLLRNVLRSPTTRSSSGRLSSATHCCCSIHPRPPHALELTMPSLSHPHASTINRQVNQGVRWTAGIGRSIDRSIDLASPPT